MENNNEKNNDEKIYYENLKRNNYAKEIRKKIQKIEGNYKYSQFFTEEKKKKKLYKIFRYYEKN